MDTDGMNASIVVLTAAVDMIVDLIADSIAVRIEDRTEDSTEALAVVASHQLPAQVLPKLLLR
jgi:hypothetical protein